MARKRYSPQRELICSFVKSTVAHPTAEMIYRQLKDRSPGLSRGTVYRNLNLLVEEGQIVRLPFPVERYDGMVEPHPHLVCSRCGSVTDLELDYDASLDQLISQQLRCQVFRHDCFFYGLCPSCTQTDE